MHMHRHLCHQLLSKYAELTAPVPVPVQWCARTLGYSMSELGRHWLSWRRSPSQARRRAVQLSRQPSQPQSTSLPQPPRSPRRARRRGQAVGCPQAARSVSQACWTAVAWGSRHAARSLSWARRGPVALRNAQPTRSLSGAWRGQVPSQAVGLGCHQAADSSSQAGRGAEDKPLSLMSQVLIAPCRTRLFQT